MPKASTLIVVFCFSFYSFVTFGASLSGIVKDETGHPLPYAAVYIQGTTVGTATNVNGVYQLSLEPGSYQVVFQYIGYRKKVEAVHIEDKPLIININMIPEEISLNEVEITSEDPAYRIIRKAIAKKDHYLKQVPAYKCRVFSKSVFRLTKAPEKIFGEKILDEGDTLGGIFYLSEAESQISFRQPDKIREEMISSKVSGNDNGFSFNYYSYFMMSFYNNLVHPPLSNLRGYVSPLSDNAMFYYRFKLEGSFIEAEKNIYKIRVTPRREMDPVFSGYLYIQEGEYRIQSAELTLGKGAGINFVDSLRISQQYVPVNDTTWMIYSQKIHFYFSLDLLGKKIGGNGVFHSQNTDYDLAVEYPKNYFSQEYIRVNRDANKKDSVYWDSARPIPLTTEEASNYRRKDSIEQRTNSKEYLDSLDHRTNRLKASALWSGYSHYNRKAGITQTISSPIIGLQFNTIQGWNLGINYSFHKKLKEDRSLRFTPDIVYGFSDLTFRAGLSALFYYNPDRFAWLRLDGGIRALKQFNGQEPISLLVNSLYSILGELNYLKAYEKSFVKVSHRSEIARGLFLNAALEFARRAPVVNHKNSPVTEISGRRFTSNDPQDPDNYNPSFDEHKSLIISAVISYTFGVKYNYIPRKVSRSGRYPTLMLSVSKGIEGVFSSKSDFTFLEAGILQVIKCGLAGQMSIRGQGGIFLNKQPIYFIDYKHFNGNRTIFPDTKQGAYQLMDYYSYSTQEYYAGFHLEHHFNGWIFNKIPLLKKTKLREVLGFHYLTNDIIQNYYEFNFGIDNIFKTIRVDFIMGFEGDKLMRNGIVIRIPFISSGGLSIEP